MVPKVSEAHLAARRREILVAAAQCFARDGFHRTSMQDIVRESGISAGLLYRYFTDKDDIIAAIVTEWHADRAAAIETAQRVPRPDTLDVNPVLAGYLELLRSVGHPEGKRDLHLGLQVWAETIRSPRLRELARQGVDGPRVALADALRSAALPRADLPADADAAFDDADLDSDALARTLIAIYQGLMLQTAWDDTLDNDAFVRAVATMLHGMAS